MLLDLFALGVFVAALAASLRPRAGLYLLIAIACLQDPVRKLTPGAPAILAIAGLPVWLGLCVGLFSNDRNVWPRFQRAHPRLARLLRAFLVCLVPPVLLVFSYGPEAWQLALLGTFTYLAPLVTMVVGFSLVRDASELRRLLRFYGAFTTLMLVGTLIEYLRWDWRTVGTEALGMVWLRYPDRGGEPFRLLSGFFRSPDIMGWHAAMLVMVSLALAVTSHRARDRVWLLATVWGAFGMIVAGRRKMIMMPALWVACMLLLYLRAGRLRRQASLGVALALVGGAFWFVSGEGAIQGDYYDYAALTIVDAPRRFTKGTLEALLTTVIQSGVMGRGIGSATQGAQHVVGGPGQSWQESGASKLMVELGVPGFICSLLVGLALVRASRTVLARVPLGSPSGGLVAGLMSIMVANAASFTVSHQVYGDLLTATLTALLLGVALSGPRWAAPVAQPQPARPVARPMLAPPRVPA